MNYLQSIIALFGATLMLFSLDQPTQTMDIVNPLPKCPSTPNCAVADLTFATDSATVLSAAETTFRDMEAQSIEWNSDSTQIHAVFRIPVFGYLDDVHVAAVPSGSDTRLFVRSASREGHWDIGVNGRRVKKFTKHIKNHLSN
ncbi:MAG: DUF1499 domain-containing protein [Balneolaceae bacterium]|nr:DUF1499 domain-containing protein [Balneolaceae bacterium]